MSKIEIKYIIIWHYTTNFMFIQLTITANNGVRGCSLLKTENNPPLYAMCCSINPTKNTITFYLVNLQLNY